MLKLLNKFSLTSYTYLQHIPHSFPLCLFICLLKTMNVGNIFFSFANIFIITILKLKVWSIQLKPVLNPSWSSLIWSFIITVCTFSISTLQHILPVMLNKHSSLITTFNVASFFFRDWANNCLHEVSRHFPFLPKQITYDKHPIKCSFFFIFQHVCRYPWSFPTLQITNLSYNCFIMSPFYTMYACSGVANWAIKSFSRETFYMYI